MKITINYTKPCTTEKKKILAEVDLHMLIDKKGFSLLKNTFKNVRLLPKLGVAKLEFDGKSILVFDSGIMHVRKAKNETDVIEIAEMILKVLEKK